MQLHMIDLFVVVAYFISLVAIGYYIMLQAQRRGMESESFLAADRNMGLIRTAGSAAATDLGGGFSIAMGGLGFSIGISGSWLIGVSALSAVLAALLMAPKIKRWADKVKGLTTGDLFETRFDKKTGTIAALLIGLAWWTFVGGQVIAGAKLVAGTLGLSVTATIIIAGVIILLYTAMGGLKAVMTLDVYQLVVLCVGVIFIMVPLGLKEVGGYSALMAKLASNPETAKLTNWGAVGWKTAIGWFLSIFPVWFISIATFQRVIAAKDEKTAKWGIFLTGFPIEWPIFAIGMTLVGLLAHVLIPNISDPELATPTMIVTILPIGLSGLVVAAYMAAVLSTADSCLMGAVAIFTNDFYRKLINPNASDKDLMRINRLAVFILGSLAIGLAYKIPTVIDLVMYAYTFGAAGLFFPMLALLFWKRATAAGAFWSILLGGGSAIAWSLMGNPGGYSGSYIGWGVSFITLVLVSLITKHSPEEQIELFYE
ncbi:Na+/solute symporter [Thermovirga lienii DSM 17291]|uniref:Na+/solute symporter n=1 Tax=Thermovirga lienii (strain ATCC BAA-1197 / DSM 17291 / Cas60314) TaxID=580340 RepID=G7V742_THELD|nr:sodium:solute symporter family protein [Thermovirga lienii]AER66076.1 Na+/solute symporter [Thermovirga lienii DSM 17291]